MITSFKGNLPRLNEVFASSIFFIYIKKEKCQNIYNLMRRQTRLIKEKVPTVREY